MTVADCNVCGVGSDRQLLVPVWAYEGGTVRVRLGTETTWIVSNKQLIVSKNRKVIYSSVRENVRTIEETKSRKYSRKTLSAGTMD